ncbi:MULTISPECIES: DUF6286 domain-containing protein [unclassified Streptomyces]|uniref:DUF6286 domain-containing protein n=1 Tax=unclassified Streptomyces TaxID=2593676 RepID=UPI00224DA5BC|nr:MULTISPECIES: DUF6286 domain-containing protein [unclassified Streptomyces]WSP58586.1 alkaline shock response membrane anchor protein AmaP [Streptomyces sp. NBC_01241]WSU20836.1 alkaline shock response membrane anchor protein AmaP [Streptomyces sp. NBC_01108]WTA39746.1 alkaline shock response membrane anchor protein AmaP [Streptomyces sp. NBC_00846]MCX4793913.1 alkaline shock response membrane anchor protein AmaP [Streptomyces sp. NBC_01242]WSJ35329.1 alkaline shock response membrane anchor
MSANTWRQPTGDGDIPSGTGQPTSSAGNPPGTGATAAVHKSGRSARRFWSARRIPAAIVALLSVAAIGLLLYDVVSVRADQPGMSWRRRLAEELATRPLHDIWMTVGAAVAMALGLWLFLLAVTPGLRRLLPMRQPTRIPRTGEVRAGLDRHAAALLLRDRAVRVSGVQSARVDVGRRKVKARAQAHFRDLNEVHADLNAALGEAVTNLGLAQQPTLDVRVRRPKKG